MVPATMVERDESPGSGRETKAKSTPERGREVAHELVEHFRAHRPRHGERRVAQRLLGAAVGGDVGGDADERLHRAVMVDEGEQSGEIDAAYVPGHELLDVLRVAAARERLLVVVVDQVRHVGRQHVEHGAPDRVDADRREKAAPGDGSRARSAR
ncbi:MAG: hypothetical protein M5U09_00860 [Gammaproteobacteria bacterium]|nr:hypothetical protein [Gammaproteobacteria bacterium]